MLMLLSVELAWMVVIWRGVDAEAMSARSRSVSQLKVVMAEVLLLKEDGSGMCPRVRCVRTVFLIDGGVPIRAASRRACGGASYYGSLVTALANAS